MMYRRSLDCASPKGIYYKITLPLHFLHQLSLVLARLLVVIVSAIGLPQFVQAQERFATIDPRSQGWSATHVIISDGQSWTVCVVGQWRIRGMRWVSGSGYDLSTDPPQFFPDNSLGTTFGKSLPRLSLIYRATWHYPNGSSTTNYYAALYADDPPNRGCASADPPFVAPAGGSITLEFMAADDPNAYNTHEYDPQNPLRVTANALPDPLFVGTVSETRKIDDPAYCHPHCFLGSGKIEGQVYVWRLNPNPDALTNIAVNCSGASCKLDAVRVETRFTLSIAPVPVYCPQMAPQAVVTSSFPYSFPDTPLRPYADVYVCFWSRSAGGETVTITANKYRSQ